MKGKCQLIHILYTELYISSALLHNKELMQDSEINFVYLMAVHCFFLSHEKKLLFKLRNSILNGRFFFFFL